MAVVLRERILHDSNGVDWERVSGELMVNAFCFASRYGGLGGGGWATYRFGKVMKELLVLFGGSWTIANFFPFSAFLRFRVWWGESWRGLLGPTRCGACSQMWLCFGLGYKRPMTHSVRSQTGFIWRGKLQRIKLSTTINPGFACQIIEFLAVSILLATAFFFLIFVSSFPSQPNLAAILDSSSNLISRFRW